MDGRQTIYVVTQHDKATDGSRNVCAFSIRADAEACRASHAADAPAELSYAVREMVLDHPVLDHPDTATSEDLPVVESGPAPSGTGR